MICIRNHTFHSRKYQIIVDNEKVTLYNSTPKYLIRKSLSQTIQWIHRDNKLIGFQINYRGKQKIFEMEEKQCELFKKTIGGQVVFLEIKNFYHALLIIGKGSFGKVFKVERFEDQKAFACKSLKIEKFQAQEDIQNEIIVQNQMDHPNILKILEVYKENKHFYLIMEYAEGGTLKQYIKKMQKALTDFEILKIIKQVLNAIDYINQQGYVHRDIKPDNILLMKYQDISCLKLTDFGFASKVNEVQTNHPYCGTPGYMAPEIVKYDGSSKYNEQCDIFSAGVLLYQLITGQDLFAGQQSEIQYQQEHFDVQLMDLKDMKSKFKNIMIGMLASIPQQRLTMREIMEQLKFIESELCSQENDFNVEQEGAIQQLKTIEINQN